MKTTIDDAGQIVIPREICHQAGLQPGMALDVCWRDGRIEIEPVPLPVRLVRRGRLLVAIPGAGGEPLTASQVDQARQALERERASRD